MLRTSTIPILDLVLIFDWVLTSNLGQIPGFALIPRRVLGPGFAKIFETIFDSVPIHKSGLTFVPILISKPASMFDPVLTLDAMLDWILAVASVQILKSILILGLVLTFDPIPTPAPTSTFDRIPTVAQDPLAPE
jgi:hypothetical protein